MMRKERVWVGKGYERFRIQKFRFEAKNRAALSELDGVLITIYAVNRLYRFRYN